MTRETFIEVWRMWDNNSGSAAAARRFEDACKEYCTSSATTMSVSRFRDFLVASRKGGASREESLDYLESDEL